MNSPADNRAAGPVMLPLLEAFFADLERRGIAYVIWKSLENLDCQLRGVGDIDLCVLPEQRTEVVRALSDHAFLCDALSNATVGDTIVIYRGFDAVCGVFVSLHVHFECRFGSKRFKEYRYPREVEMVRDWRDDRGVHRLADGHFMATRLLMATVKPAFDDSLLREVGVCYGRMDRHDRAVLDDAVQRYFAAEPDVLIPRLATEGTAALDGFRKTAIARLDSETDRAEWMRSASRRQQRPTLRWRFMRLIGRSRCKLLKPAQIVLTGPDGSGKSTVCKKVAYHMGTIGSARVIYLGRRHWSPFNRLVDRWRSRPLIGAPLNAVWPLTSTAEILFRVGKGRFLKWMGVTVVYDRSIYDVELKFRRDGRMTARLVCAVARRVGAGLGDLRYFMFAEPRTAAARKPAGTCTVAQVADAKARFEEILGSDYRPLDTSSRSADDVANEIVAEYFRAARNWRPRI